MAVHQKRNGKVNKTKTDGCMNQGQYIDQGRPLELVATHSHTDAHELARTRAPPHARALGLT